MGDGPAKILYVIASVNARPSFIKKIDCRIGALSHSLLYQISFIDLALYVPDGVEFPSRPVETGL
jgi:hypothetical protein